MNGDRVSIFRNALSNKKSLLFLAFTLNKTVFGAFTSAELEFSGGIKLFKDPNAFLFNLALKKAYRHLTPLENVVKA
jgi:hypothetical protein